MSICVTLLPSWDGQMVAYLYKVDSINHSAGHKRRHKHGRKRNTNPSQMGTLRHVYPHILLFYASCVYDMMTLWHLHSRRLWRPGSRQTGQWLFSRRYPGEKMKRRTIIIEMKTFGHICLMKLHVTRACLIIVWPVTYRRCRATVSGRPGQYRTHLI